MKKKPITDQFSALPPAAKAVCLLSAGGLSVLLLLVMIATLETWFPPVLLICGIVGYLHLKKAQKRMPDSMLINTLSEYLYQLFQNPKNRELFELPVKFVTGITLTDLQDCDCLHFEMDDEFCIFCFLLHYKLAPEYGPPYPSGGNLEIAICSALENFSKVFCRRKYGHLPAGEYRPRIIPRDVVIIDDHTMQIELMFADCSKAQAYANFRHFGGRWFVLDQEDGQEDIIIDEDF